MHIYSTLCCVEGILQFEGDCDALLSWDDRIAEVCAEVSVWCNEV